MVECTLEIRATYSQLDSVEQNVRRSLKIVPFTPYSTGNCFRIYTFQFPWRVPLPDLLLVSDECPFTTFLFTYSCYRRGCYGAVVIENGDMLEMYQRRFTTAPPVNGMVDILSYYRRTEYDRRRAFLAGDQVAISSYV